METKTGNGTALVTSSYKNVVAISGLRSHLARLESLVIEGRVSAVGGMAAEIDGLAGYATIGTRLTLAAHNGSVLIEEYVADPRLSEFFEAAARHGQREALFAKLTALAYFLARLHNRTANGLGVCE